MSMLIIITCNYHNTTMQHTSIISLLDPGHKWSGHSQNDSWSEAARQALPVWVICSYTAPCLDCELLEVQTPWLLLFYRITVLQGTLRLGIQCPPADLIHLTEVTLPISGPKWAPGSPIPFPILLVPAQSTRWLHSHSLGVTAPNELLTF